MFSLFFIYNMGCCETKQNKNIIKINNDIKDLVNSQSSLSFSITKEAYIPGYDKSLYKSQIENDKKRKQMEKSICKIVGEIKGTGFLCLIKSHNFLFRVLITCNHVLNDLKIGNELKLVFDDGKEMKILLDESRTIYTIGNNENDKYDISIIELKTNEFDLDDYLTIDDDIYKFDEFNKIYKGKIIYIIHYEKGKNLKYSAGPIIKIDKNNNIFHCCATENGSSGAPILNLNNSQVIGIHFGYVQKLNSNIGKIIKYPIDEFIKKKEKIFIDNIKEKLLSAKDKTPGQLVDLE